MIRGFQRTPACTGKEGLFRLLTKAHSLYSEEVMTRQKSYRRFVLDFIHSIRYHDNSDAWSKNEHSKNYGIITGLLLNHEKMVRKSFDCESIDEQKLSNLLHEFYTCDLPRPQGQSDIAAEVSYRELAEPNANTNILLDRETINLIVRLANEVNLSKEVLDVEETAQAYERYEMKPIVSANNARLVLVLDRLAAHNVIPYNWQTQIERKRIVLSSSGKKFLNRHDLASTLNRIKELPLSSENNTLLSIVDNYVRLIKNSQIK